jgi:hypothetical protein
MEIYMRIKILFVVLAVSILLMSSCVMAIIIEIPPGLSKEKNVKAPGHWKKNTEFESQKHFVNEIHNVILLRKESEESLPPVAIITWTNQVYPNKPIFFNADASYDPDGGDITLIEWDFNGDGIYENVLNNVNPILLVYDSTGTCYIGLRVTDDEGQINAVLETIIVIDQVT